LLLLSPTRPLIAAGRFGGSFIAAFVFFIFYLTFETPDSSKIRKGASRETGKVLAALGISQLNVLLRSEVKLIFQMQIRKISEGTVDDPFHPRHPAAVFQLDPEYKVTVTGMRLELAISDPNFQLL
jgi:hypothetical protein